MLWARFQNSLDPGSLFNIAQLNSSLCLNFFNMLGLDTVSKRVKPLLAFLREEIAATKPDENGFFIERFYGEKEKCERIKAIDATFYGKRGESHTIGSLMDLFIAGTTDELLL